MIHPAKLLATSLANFLSLLSLLPLLANCQTITPSLSIRSQTARISPKYNHDFEFPLPIMPIKQPLTTYTNKTTGVQIDFYEVKIREFTKNLFPGLGDATLTGYDGLEPGPTFRIRKGRETVIRFINEYYRPSSVHLHGSYSRAPFDGWAEDIIQPGEHKDYYYPNTQEARTLWYHDHAIDLTTLNTYSGQIGFYILEDPILDELLDVPRGAYDIPLLLNSRLYTPTGNITDESSELIATYGDTPSVNGQILPHLIVEPRKYRFRILNASASRTFNLTLNADLTGVNRLFHVVGSDAGFMSHPVETESLITSMAERWEIVIDFADFAGRNLTMKQTNSLPDIEYVGYDRIMQFRVGSTVSDETGNGPLPATLVSLDLPTNKTGIDKEFALGRINDVWTINNVSFSDVANRILHKVPRGTTEKWRFVGGLGNHPIHMHLIDFQILSRERGGKSQTAGRTYITPYEAASIKDVVLLAPNEVVTVLAKYAPWDGVYMFHCHNTIHEDHGMMAAFNVTSLSNFGYSETSKLVDPMEPRFRAKPYKPFSATEINSVLESFSGMGVYTDVKQIDDALDEYWATHGHD